MPTCAAIIVAAGRGHRVGGELPKQYRMLHGKTLLRRTVEIFTDHPEVDLVQVVIHPDDRPLYDESLFGLNVRPPVNGGETRQDSVLNGLESLVTAGPDYVLIHDAARPFTSPKLISDILKELEKHDGAIPAIAVSDTLKRNKNGGKISETVDREGLWQAQTPQGFRYRKILEAHKAAAGKDLTDDASVAEAAGLDVRVVPSAEKNFKVTTPEDFERAENEIGALADIRTGFGFDVHAFTDGNQVTLCGVQIPHEKALSGHSDADVGLHAITDALLGALGEGDIGAHFPPSDQKWKNADSEIFLSKARELAEVKGATILNVDLTIICEAPKIGPHRDAMTANVARILDITPERVGIKATTTEKMGFTGRGEGMAAQAVATLRF